MPHRKARISSLFIMTVGLSLGVQADEQLIDDSCAKWSIKGLSLDMTLGELKSAHPKANRKKKNLFREGDRRKGWYVWPENRMQGLWSSALPEHDSSSAGIVALTVMVDQRETSSEDIVEALVERWGEPVVRRGAYKSVRYANQLGASVEYDWLVTVWEDEACDTLVRFEEQSRVSPSALPMHFNVWLIHLDRLSSLARSDNDDLERARDVVPP